MAWLQRAMPRAAAFSGGKTVSLVYDVSVPSPIGHGVLGRLETENHLSQHPPLVLSLRIDAAKINNKQ